MKHSSDDTSNPQKKDYPKEAFEALFKIEDKHFWFAAREEVIKIVLNTHVQEKKGQSFLEIGCGTGIVLMLLEKLGFSVTGLDIHQEGLRIARKRTKARLIRSDLFKLTTKEKYQNIGLFDVIEHIENDERFLRACRNILVDNGKVFITVPADTRLWSRMDEASGHKRRYSKQELISVLQESGFTVEYISYFNALLYVPLFLFRRFSDFHMREESQSNLLVEELKLPIAPVNVVLKWLLLAESQLLKFTSIPVGSSVIAVGVKKD